MQPQQQQTSAWVTTMLWATAGAAVMFVAKKVGLLS